MERIDGGKEARGTNSRSGPGHPAQGPAPDIRLNGPPRTSGSGNEPRQQLARVRLVVRRPRQQHL
ncbi:hypothetical protein SAV14893_059650 [Streptomyces avermitilis]|uniref:Uncharacterized protein n=1 Tax=Streptomyces avermitilis TaxID=33903 RepID=A0A4D4MM62_STRAX|nr:hypothetical protein SAVMC3_71970 [Streptomyces avermitilis]GDY66572.1 hypothetical protein SAV14893_059650 [Streptomyces avermitilis]GDY73191.1 hypothetical protein SAV31267_026760 [Streptomyces avermitilis]GDY82294.1 hypothetical protein SAVCW2_14930 [Streptomyces avermitilis]